MDSQLGVQVAAGLQYPRIGSLSLWERARVRGKVQATKKPADNHLSAGFCVKPKT
jgi:hypothetical protein